MGRWRTRSSSNECPNRPEPRFICQSWADRLGGPADEALVQGPAFPLAAQEQQLPCDLTWDRDCQRAGDVRLGRPRTRRRPVRDPDPHHQLHQGGERDQQVPVVAAGGSLRRPGPGGRESRDLQDLDRVRIRARCAERGGRDDHRRRAAALPCHLGRDRAGISVAGGALLHLAPDHGRSDAERRAAHARPLRPAQLGRNGHSDRPRPARRNRFRRRRVVPGLCRHLVRD